MKLQAIGILFSSNDEIIPFDGMGSSGQKVIILMILFAKRIKMISSIILFKGGKKIAV